jgi:threonyl-tRNA synthetase
LKADCELEIQYFDQAKHVFWHSSAHILGYAIEDYFKESVLTFGPAIKEGFFYDFYEKNDKKVHEEDYAHLEKRMK